MSKELVEKMLAALEAQELASTFSKEGNATDPGDERYTPYIGQWDGYQAPELRWYEFQRKRKAMRRMCITEAKEFLEGDKLDITITDAPKEKRVGW